MSDFLKFQELLEEARESLVKGAYTQGGVASVSDFSGQVGSPSSEVLLTGDAKKKKRLDKKMKQEYPVPPVHAAPDVKTEGIKTTTNGKRLPVTGLSSKEKDEYLFGDTEIDNKPKRKK